MKKRILILFLCLSMVAILSVGKKGNIQFEFVDNIDMNDINETDEISVVIELNYNPVNYDITMTDDINLNRKERDRLRENNKNYYYQNNLRLVNALDMNIDNDFVISQYSPFVFIDYDSYADYKNDVSYLKATLNNDMVSKVFVEKKTRNAN